MSFVVPQTDWENYLHKGTKQCFAYFMGRTCSSPSELVCAVWCSGHCEHHKCRELRETSICTDKSHWQESIMNALSTGGKSRQHGPFYFCMECSKKYYGRQNKYYRPPCGINSRWEDDQRPPINESEKPEQLQGKSSARRQFESSITPGKKDELLEPNKDDRIAALEATIAVLEADKAVLEADKAVLEADKAFLEAENAALKIQTAALKEVIDKRRSSHSNST